MVADVDGDRRRPPGRCADSAANTAALDTPRPRSSAARRAFSARQIAQRAATSGRWSTASARPRRAARAAPRTSRRRRRARRRSTGSNRPIAAGGRRRPARSACTARCRCGWRTRPRSRASRSDSFISQRRDRRAGLRPSTPRAERVGVGHQALGLERGEHRRAEPLGQRAHLVAARRARRARRRSPAAGRRASRSRRRRQRRRRAARPARSAQAARPGAPAGASRRAGPAPRRGARGGRRRGRRRACLTASAASSAWSEPACTVTVESGDVAEHRRQVEVLEGAAAEHLRRHLARRSRRPARRRAWRRRAR